MRKHLALTCLAYMYWGIGVTVWLLGKKAGINFTVMATIYATSGIFFFIVIFTSMEKVKDKLGIDQDAQGSDTTKFNQG